MADTNGQLRFTLSQLIQLLIIMAAGIAAFVNVKADLRVLDSHVSDTLQNHENRIGSLERWRHHEHGNN